MVVRLSSQWLVLTMTFDLAMSFAGLLMVTSIQGVGPNPQTEPASGASEVVVRNAERQTWKIAIDHTSEFAKIEPDGDRIEFRIDGRLARLIADSIFQLVSVQWRRFEETEEADEGES